MSSAPEAAATGDRSPTLSVSFSASELSESQSITTPNADTKRPTRSTAKAPKAENLTHPQHSSTNKAAPKDGALTETRGAPNDHSGVNGKTSNAIGKGNRALHNDKAVVNKVSREGETAPQAQATTRKTNRVTKKTSKALANTETATKALAGTKRSAEQATDEPVKKAKKAPAAKAPAKQAAKGKDAKETKPKPATSRARKAPAKKEASNSKDTAAPKPAPTTIGKKRSADALQSEQPEPQAKKRKVGGKVSGAGPSSNPQEPGKAEIASAAGPRNQPHLNDKTVPQGNTAPPTNGKKPTAKKPAPKAKATANTGKRAHLRRQATMNASSPNNGINGAGSIPLTRSGAPDFARMTVEQALSVPMDFDLPRARNSRPNALDTRSYASVVDTLPSEREMLSADRFAAERDHAAEVSRMDRMRDEAVEKAVRLDLAMMKYQKEEEEATETKEAQEKQKEKQRTMALGTGMGGFCGY